MKVTKKEAVSSGSDIILDGCDRISLNIEDNLLSAKARKIFLQTGIPNNPCDCPVSRTKATMDGVFCQG